MATADHIPGSRSTSRPAQRSSRLDVTAVGDRQIVMTRRFAAPPALVFDALVTPELLLRWMHGPDGWQMIGCELDATEGGRFCYEWRGPAGERMTAGGVVREIVRPERLVVTECFDDDWTAGEVLSVFELAAEGASTRLTNTATYVSGAARDGALASGMERGVDASYDHLDRLLSATRPEGMPR